MRVMVCVDGFNVYHALEAEGRLRRFKWLDYVALAKCYLQGKETLAAVKIFTALATWNQEKVNRHQDLLTVQRFLGAQVIMGRFKRRDRKCRQCGEVYPSFEEKETDVNIAIHLFEDAYMDVYDKAILITGDSDIVPAVKAVRRLFLTKKVGVVCPIGRSSNELKEACDFHFQMKERQLERCQLPGEVDCGALGIKRRPSFWK